MAVGRYTRKHRPTEGPVHDLLEYVDACCAKRRPVPSIATIASALHLHPVTVRQWFTGERLIPEEHLPNLIAFVDGDIEYATRLREAAEPAWREWKAAKSAVAAPPDEPEPAPGWTAAPDSTAGIDVIFYTTPANRANYPSFLVGRGDLIDSVGGLLDHGNRVLLHGLGGSGKTAVAATIADRRVEANRGPYLWVRVGTSSKEIVFDAIARCLAVVTGRASLGPITGDAQLLAIGDAITASGATLCVIDDVWNAGALHAVLGAVPPTVGVLVTSRFKIGLPHQVALEGLDPASSAALLAYHAHQESFAQRPDTMRLCAALAHHPYLVEIAGHRLRQYSLNPGELHDQIDEPTKMRMPADFAPPGMESGQGLLDTTFEILPADARAALAAAGGLFSGSVTPSLISHYLGFTPGRTLAALNALVDVSFAKRSTDARRYTFHDLTVGYARVALADPNGDAATAVAAIRSFVDAESKNHNLIALDRDNVIAALEIAQELATDDFLAIVTALADSGYMDTHGTLGLLTLVDAAIEVLRDRGDVARLDLLLGKRGNACYFDGEFADAAGFYRQALDIALAQPRRAVLLSLIGLNFAELRRYEESDEAFDRAYAAAEADEFGTMRVVEVHTVAASRRGDYARERELAERGVELSRRLNHRPTEAILLNNLGTAHFHLGIDMALKYHREAMAIGEADQNERMLALTHHTVGIDHLALEEFEEAVSHFAEALRLYERLGERSRMAKVRRIMDWLSPTVDGA
jgi:tetratricopeptide (TPR) repeat protein